MKKTFTLAMVLLLAHGTYAQTYIKTMRSAVLSSVRRMIATKDGGYLVAGFAGNTSNVYNTYDFHVMKFNASGAAEWSGRYGNPNVYEDGLSAIQTKDKGYLLTGFMQDESGKKSGVILKIDSVGKKHWSKTLNGAYSLSAATAVQTADKGYLVGCNYEVGFETRIVLVKMDADGTVTKYLKLGPNDRVVANVRKLITAKNGDIVLLADAGKFNRNHKLIVARCTETGTTKWVKRFGSPYSDAGVDIIETRDQGFAVTGGNTIHKGFNTYEFITAKLDSVGNVNWVTSAGNNFQDSHLTSGYALLEESDGTLISCGSLDDYEHITKLYMVKYSTTGQITYTGVLARRRFGGNSFGRGIFKTKDGGYLVGGTTMEYGYNGMLMKGNDSFTFCRDLNPNLYLKHDSSFVVEDAVYRFSEQLGIAEGEGIPVMSSIAKTQTECAANPSIINKQTPVTSALQKMVVYPNPATAYINIQFKSEKAGTGILQVYDMLGTPYLQSKLNLVAGNNSNKINIASLPAGQYKITLTTDNGLLTAPFYKQ